MTENKKIMKEFFRPAENDFMDELYQESIQNEKIRLRLFAAVVGFLFIYISFIALLNFPVIKKGLGGIPGFFTIMGILLIVFFRQLMLSKMISRRLKKGKRIPLSIRYVNMLVETSIPTVGLLVIAKYSNSYLALQTPASIFYFVIIILSIFDLDERISLFSGLLSALQYFLLYMYLTGGKISKADHLLSQPFLYAGHSMMLLVSGIAAGAVTFYIRTRVGESLKAAKEQGRIEKLFSQQVSEEIMNAILKDNSVIIGSKRNVCIMFLDIRGFSIFTANKSPEEIIAYQNNVLSFMIDIVNENKGIVNQLLGDGFMATFGAPVTYPNNSQNAFEAGVKILTRLKEKCLKNELPPTRIGIGLSSGEVITGNVGTEKRKQYSIIGNTVILAARIEQQNKALGTQMLISESTKACLENCQLILKAHGPVDLKGSSEPVKLYEVSI